MESGNGVSSSTGHFLPVPVSSDDFLNTILAQLQSAYLFEESKHSFKYTAAFLIKNSVLEEKYNACREKRREQGYVDEELKETYGFLLFDELGKAKSIGETGVLTGNGSCTTLGDPTKGVYLSMYSDCLDLNRWYHGKSGYITILRLIQGRVKKVSENYTQNLTEPTVGFDCHVSEQLPSVSSKTSSFLAFERTQYYLYELLDNGSTAPSPSLACPYAIVAFSYTDTKETQQEKSKEKKVACPYSPWMGTLQIGSQTFSVGIRSTTGGLTRAKLPPVIKAERAISMLNLRKLLPKAIFDTTLNGKAIQEDLDCSLCEIVALSSEEKEKLTPLVLEIKEKDVALITTLSDGGFLVLIHESHFNVHDNDNEITTNKVLQGVFVFPESQAIQRVTKNDQMKRSLPLDVLRVLPLLTYAEGEIEKNSLNTNEDLCEIFVHYMQSYATLISPGLSSSPFREVSIFPDQYDVPDTHGHLYSTPEWTDKQWQSVKLYLNNANSFQLPTCKASEIFVAGQEVRREDLEDDIYICLSSPEEPSTSFIITGSEDRPDQECSTNVEAIHDISQPVSTTSQMVPNILQTQEALSEISNSVHSTEKVNKCKETSELPLRTDEPSEELVVSITSAARTGVEGLDVIKHHLSASDLQTATLNSLSEIVESKITSHCSEDSNLVTDSDTLPLGQNLESAQSPSLQIVKTLLGKDELFCMDHVTTKELEKHLNTSETQESQQENEKIIQVLEQGDTNLTDNALLKELETCTLRKKSERWGLKPVISTCGRIFIPYGSVDTEQIKSLQEKLRLTKDEIHPEENIADALSEISNASKKKQEMGDNKETKPTEEGHHRKSVDHISLDKYMLTSDTDHLLEEHKENHIKDIPTVEKSKGEIMLKRLKSVILKKRNKDGLRIGLSLNEGLDNDLSPKRARRDLMPVNSKSSIDKCAKETNVDNQHLANLPSVDPIFAHALGLTPKGTLDVNCVQNSGELSIEKEISTEKEMVLANEYPSCKKQPLSSPKGLGPRLKMLKKNQCISAEQVKKKWWLHFQTPTCYAEKQYEGSSRDISVRKTVKEKTDTSSEALNLLADLALSANKEQVSPHPIEACLQEFVSSLKKCEITKDESNPEQQSALHTLLRQPASKPIQPRETSSSDSFGGSELVDVICQEHAYSLPSSPSLLLALPAPFQVSPLNGSSRMLHTQRLWDEAQTMHPIIYPDDKAESNRKDPGDPKRSWYRRKFSLLRNIVNKEKSVQVTRHWEGLYDFNLDSRFTVDPKDKTIVRALHGPWDLSIHDTTEEVQLIVHMWIGLFYSRSTARFFHLDPDITLASSEDDVLKAMDVSIEKGHEQSISETVLSTPFSNEKGYMQRISETVLSTPFSNEMGHKQSTSETVLSTPFSNEKGHKQSTSETVLSTPFSNEKGHKQSTSETVLSTPFSNEKGHKQSTSETVLSTPFSNEKEHKQSTSETVLGTPFSNEKGHKQSTSETVLSTASSDEKEHKQSTSETVLNTPFSNENGHQQIISETVLSTLFSNEKRHKQSTSEMDLTCSLPNEVDKFEPKILDLSKPKNCVVDKESVVLNLSQRPSKMENANQTLSTLNPQGLQATLPFQWHWNLIHTAGNATPLKYVGFPINENCYSSELNHQLFIPVWDGITNTNIWANNVPTPVLPAAETNNHKKPENASVYFPESQETPIRKLISRKRTRKNFEKTLSSVPHTKESQKNENMLKVKDNLSNMNTSTDLHPVNGEIMSSKHLLEIKKKYLEKLASVNQHKGFPTSQNDKEDGNCNLLKKLLQDDNNTDTPKPQQPPASKTIPSQNSQLNTSSCHESSLFNQNVVRRQHVFAFPKAFTTSIVTETTCTENSSEQESLNIVDLAPLAEAENGKSTSVVDSISLSSTKMNDESEGQCVAMGLLPEFVNQDMNIRNSDTLAENSKECSLPQEDGIKTVEASLITETNMKNSPRDEAENSRSVTIPFIGKDTSIEEMLKGDATDEMDKEKGVEDMEITPSDSSSDHSEVTTSLPSNTDCTSHEQPSNHIETSVASSKVNNPFDIGGGETYDRCPTPTIDEQPYVYTSQSDLKYSGNKLDKVGSVKMEAERSSTPVLDETCAKAAPIVDSDAKTEAGAQSDVELRTLRTLRCLDAFLSTLQYKSNQLSDSKHSLNVSANTIHDFRDVKPPSSMSDSCSESAQYLYASSSSDVFGGVQQSKENCPTSHLSVPGMLTKLSPKLISSAEKPEQAIASCCSLSPDIIETPSKMYQGQNIPLKQMTKSDCDVQSKPIKFSIKRTKQGKFVCSGSVFDALCQNKNCPGNIVSNNLAPSVQQDVENLQSTEDISPDLPTQSLKSVKSTFKYGTKHDTDSRDKSDMVKIYTDEDLLNSTTSFVDSKTNKITDDSLGNEGSLSCTVTNTNTKRKGSSFLEKVSQRCLQDDSTQSSMDQECLIFFDKMKQLLKKKNQCHQIHCDQSKLLSTSPITVQFSHLQEQDDMFDDMQIPFSFLDQKISVDMSDREQLMDVSQQSSSRSLPYREQGELEQPGVSAITAECARLYRDIMNKICSGNVNTSLIKDLHKMDSGDSTTDSCNYFDFCSQMKREMDDSFRNKLNSVVKKSCKTKNRFFLLITSDDVFFNEARGYLEAEGHIAVQPSDFFLRESSSSPLLVIIRNEDIAEHIFKVPHLLQLRKSPVVQFAGIDEPDDVVNLTYQEVFIKGGFVMFDQAAVESLSPGNVRTILEILQRLIQTGKWKWVLHYRDSRRLKENARLCPDAKEKVDLLNKCKEDGLLDVLPYHECDLMSREQPNYLQCLCHQQVQNISARYPVFVSDSETDKGFEKNGIVTMTINSFLMDSLSKIINAFTSKTD